VKFIPVIVTDVPPAVDPEVGFMPVTVGVELTAPPTWRDWLRLLCRASVTVSDPLTFAVADALILAYTVVVERLPLASG
jgi:hypothetical protein